MLPNGRVQVSLSVALINKSICQRVRSCVRTAVLEEKPKNKASEWHLPVVCKCAEHKQHMHLRTDSKPKSRPGIPLGAVAPCLHYGPLSSLVFQPPRNQTGSSCCLAVWAASACLAPCVFVPHAFFAAVCSSLTQR